MTDEEESPQTDDSPAVSRKADGALKQTIDSATALAKAVPVYQDAVQPLAQETGKALGTIGKTVNMALAPLAAMVWGYDRIKDYLESRLAEKLENVPEEQVQPPTRL